MTLPAENELGFWADQDPLEAGVGDYPPSLEENTTRYYASGPHLEELGELKTFGLNIIGCGDKIGRAAAIKM